MEIKLPQKLRNMQQKSQNMQQNLQWKYSFFMTFHNLLGLFALKVRKMVHTLRKKVFEGCTVQ